MKDSLALSWYAVALLSAGATLGVGCSSRKPPSLPPPPAAAGTGEAAGKGAAAGVSGSKAMSVTAGMGGSPALAVPPSAGKGGNGGSIAGGTGGAAAQAGASGTVGESPTVGPPAGDPAKRWWTYGYDDHNTQTNPYETTIGPDNVVGLKERWRVKFPAGGTSTPIVYDGTVYFGGWDGNAYAVDAQSGEIRWQRRLTDLLIRSTPLVTEQRVFVAAGPNLVALNRADGTLIFETELSSHPEVVIDSSPKLVDGLILIGVSSIENTFAKQDYSWIGGIAAIDAISGDEVWRIRTTGDGPGRCVGGAGASVWSSVAIDQELGLAYVGTGQTYEPPASNCSDALLAFHYQRDFQGERIEWVNQFTVGDIYAVSPASSFEGPDADIGASPNLFDAGGKTLIGVGDKAGSYRVFDRKTGQPAWRADGLGLGSFTQAGGVRATAAVYDGTVFVASNILSELSLLTGSLIGTASPDDGANIYAFNAETGEIRWKLKAPSTIDGSFVIANGVLYHVATHLGLFARDPATGKELWKVELQLAIGAGPSVVDGRIYLSAGYNVVSADTTTPQAEGSQLISYGLEADATPKVWQARVDAPKSYTKPECESAVTMASDWPGGERPSADCASCLCECNATASGNCDTCWLQAPCAVQSCPFSAAGTEMHNCMSLLCVTKLLPTYVFERSVEAAPCAIKCAATCGFW